MAITQMDYIGGGSGTLCASGYLETVTASQTVTTTDDTTGVAFEPKKLLVNCMYGTSSNFSCIYDKDTSSNTYIRRNGTATPETLPVPRTADKVGLNKILSNGFQMYGNSNTDFKKLYYIAIG